MHSLDIKGFTYDDRQGYLTRLTHVFADCGGWVVERRTLSPRMSAFGIEIQINSILDLYAALVSSGLELTRAGHLSLTELCTCRRHLRTSADLGQVVALRIEITFLEDVTLHSLLSTVVAPA
jgi:hypothetical protein